MIRCGITEKRLKNQRFKKTEDLIIKVLFDGKCNSIKSFAKEIGIARSTIYLHHHRIAAIPSDYKHYILYMYKKSLKQNHNRYERIEVVFRRLLLFIMQNKKFFKIALINCDRTVFIEMIEMTWPLIERIMSLPRNSRRMLKVYVGEAEALLHEWSQMDFSEQEMKRLLENFLYITRTFRVRLAPIMDN